MNPLAQMNQELAYLEEHLPELLWYESPDLTKPDCKSEIWIPVSQR